jgi:hypothetical protein
LINACNTALPSRPIATIQVAKTTTGQPVFQVSLLPDLHIVALLACCSGIFGRWPI